MTIVRVTAVAASLFVSAVAALATDAPITGKKLVVRDTPSPRLVPTHRPDGEPPGPRRRQRAGNYRGLPRPALPLE